MFIIDILKNGPYTIIPFLELLFANHLENDLGFILNHDKTILISCIKNIEILNNYM